MPRFKRSITRLVLIPSTGGCFELTVGQETLYSKLETGRFPDEAKLLAAVARVLGD